jgi:hypothetical protein
MSGSIIITSMKTYKEQSGCLHLIDPDTTVRPITHWSVPRWWWKGTRVVYEGCARVDNLDNGEIIYVASNTRIPRLKIRYDGGCYYFDEDFKREHIDRIWITTDPLLIDGIDYFVPLRGPITPVLGDNCHGGPPPPTCVNIPLLPQLATGASLRPVLPCVFGVPTDILLLPELV